MMRQFRGKTWERTMARSQSMSPTPFDKRPSYVNLKKLHPVKLKTRKREEDVEELYNLIKDRVPVPVPEGGGKRIIDHITLDKILSIKSIFEASKGGTLPWKSLKSIIKKCCPNLSMKKSEWDSLFLKIDRGSGKCNWSDFNHYLLLEYKEKQTLEESDTAQFLDVPIKTPPHIVSGQHKHSINDIVFQPFLNKDKTWSYSNGKYITVSREGGINIWSLNLDLESTQTSNATFLVFQKTFVTKIEMLPDVDMLATSSTEGELRFYEILGENYQLKTVITDLPQPAVALAYHYEVDPPYATFAFGDVEGTVAFLKMNNKGGGPLRNYSKLLSTDFQHIKYYNLEKGKYAKVGLQLIAYPKLHPAWVEQISWFNKLNKIVSCSSGSSLAMAVLNPDEAKVVTRFSCYRGISCFCAIEETEQLATGGFDCVLRVWNAHVSKQPLIDLHGHLAPIVHIVEQFGGRRLYSLSKDKTIKVWSTVSRTCLMTYGGKLNELGEAPLVAFYNPAYRTYIICGINIALLKIGAGVNPHYSDGHTHAEGVTKALYNTTFQTLVTVGMDSIIAKWDLMTGKKYFIIRGAHTEYVHGEEKIVGIVSADFSPCELFLVTGGINGSVKIWNIVYGNCVRTLNIENGCAAMSVLWYNQKILASGWNKFVVEWDEKAEPDELKNWKQIHTDRIVSAVLCEPGSIATASYNGEIVFSDIRNCLYYKIINVGKPDS